MNKKQSYAMTQGLEALKRMGNLEIVTVCDKPAAHTPTPWVVKGANIKSADKLIGTLSSGVLCAPTPNEAQANAAFIVQAVNAHDALVAASTEALNALMELLPQIRDGVACADEIKRAVAAQEPLIEALKLAGAA